MVMSKLSGAIAGAAVMIFGARTFVAPSAPNTSAPRVHVQAGVQSPSTATSTAQLAGMGVGVAAITAAMVGGRAARRTKAVVSPQTALAVMPKQLQGTGGPMPDDVWDPLGLSTNASEEQLLRWRAVELKHGRVSMLACVGWWHVAQGIHPVGDSGAKMTLSDDPLVAAAQMPMAGMWQVVFTIMVLEWLFEYVCVPPKNRPWDLFGWEELLTEEGQEAQDYKDAQLQELNDGRLAMIGFIGLVATEIGSGGKYYGKLFDGISLQGSRWAGKPNWPVLDPRFDPDDTLALFGGFNNFLLYARGINPFADQLV